jgi:hypothetical protein
VPLNEKERRRTSTPYSLTVLPRELEETNVTKVLKEVPMKILTIVQLLFHTHLWEGNKFRFL